MDRAISDKILKYSKEHAAEMERFLFDIVSMESPTDDAASQKAVLDRIQGELEDLGYYVFRMPGRKRGGFLYARPDDREKGLDTQLLIGHCDTVWPINTIQNMPIRHEDGRIHGPGIFDMKAGITQIIFALKALRDLDISVRFAPTILINSDEEKGSRESSASIARLARVAKRAFILEPPMGLEGKLKTARKGLGSFTLTVHGKPAHAGLDPGKGASAILELSHQVQTLFSLNNIEKGISVNVGLIEGGMSPNTVAPTASAVVDVRVLTHEDGEFITQAINNLKPNDPETAIFIEGAIGRPPMEKTERNRLLWYAAHEAGQKMGLVLEEATAGGGSDGNTTSLYTATLDGLGTTGDGAHANHEFIFSDKLSERTALLIHLLML